MAAKVAMTAHVGHPSAALTGSEEAGQRVPRIAAKVIHNIVCEELLLAEHLLQEQLKMAGQTLAMNHRRVVEAVGRQGVGEVSCNGFPPTAPVEPKPHTPSHVTFEGSTSSIWSCSSFHDEFLIGQHHSSKHLPSTPTSHGRKRVSTAVRDALKHDKTKSEKKTKTVFADADALKAQLRSAIGQKEFVAADFYHETGFCQYIARHRFFEPITLSIIALNAFWIGIDTDHGSIDNPGAGFIAMEHFFCAYFFFEAVIRTGAFARARDSLLDLWYLFDTMLACLMVVETWLLPSIFAVTGLSKSASSGAGELATLKLLRLLRLTRMARLIRLMRALPELMILVKGMTVAFRSVCFTLCLLVIFLYVFGIAFTQLTRDTLVGTRYFSTVLWSMNTLVLHGTFLENCDTVSNELGDEHELLRVLFLLYILLASLTVMNMLVGVLVEVINVVSAVEREALQVNFVKQRLGQIISDYKLDATGDGMISKAEFEMLLGNPEAARALRDVGVDVIGLVDYHDFLFDEEHEDGFSFPTFMEIVLSLRGGNPATVKDLVDLRKFLMQETLALESRIAAKLESKGSLRHPMKAAESTSSYASAATNSRPLYLQDEEAFCRRQELIQELKMSL